MIKCQCGNPDCPAEIGIEKSARGNEVLYVKSTRGIISTFYLGESGIDALIAELIAMREKYSRKVIPRTIPNM